MVMNKILYILLSISVICLTGLHTAVYGADIKNNSDMAAFTADEDSVYGDCDIMPEYIPGLDSLVELITKKAVYPASALKAGIEGKVFISFIVEKDGYPSGFEVIKGLGKGCDEEALRVIRKMGRWTPGLIKNRPVRVKLMIPVVFSLPESSSEKTSGKIKKP